VVPDASPSDADIAKALAEREAADIPPADAGQPDTQPANAVLPKEAPREADGSAASAGKAPADVAVSPAPDGSATPSADDLAAALAASQAIPEASTPETAAAREAAQEASVAPVAALVEENAPVVESETTRVTTENSRSATEDFATDIRGAVRSGEDIPVVGGQAGQGQAGQAPVTVTPAPADGVQQATEEDRDESRSRDRTDDLLGIALPALAGLIAGQMLSNNRQVTLNTGDRVVVTRPDGSQEIIKDDNALLQRPGSTVQTQEFADGSTRTVVTREDGSQVVTIRDRDLRVLRRTLVNVDGTTTALIDDTTQVEPVVVSQLPPPAQPIAVAPGQQLSESELRDALRREVDVNRTFTLGQIRNIPEVRALVAPIDIQAITFDTGSAAIKPDQAQKLATLGRVISECVRSNPGEMFLIEGHTDSVGQDATNLALSDRRAESVALALTEFFDVPPENMVVQGYGEQFLKVPAEGDVRANRRAAVRRITDLLARS
ncbi:MAG TPA: OmpA family protein, partial [Paracoccus sp. (in: a-proteobacteria)]|nr:OmpA family protein [Paracoccus sp. (in: a-proteobacteria)]